MGTRHAGMEEKRERKESQEERSGDGGVGLAELTISGGL